MLTTWACLAASLPPALRVDCHKSGQYLHKAVGGDSGPAHKHTAATGHPTHTSSQPTTAGPAFWVELREPERA